MLSSQFLAIRVYRLRMRNLSCLLCFGLILPALDTPPAFADENATGAIVIPSMDLAGEKNPFGIEVTRYPEASSDQVPDGNDGRLQDYPTGQFNMNFIDSRMPGSESKGGELIIVLVNDSIRRLVVPELDRYLDDLAYDGYLAELYATSGGTEKDIKAFLQENYFNRQLAGAVLIGDLPLAYFELSSCYDNVSYECFPCDLYYMDMDGVWEDNNHNGVYDVHRDHMVPEIFVGRLKASGLLYLGSSEKVLLKNYFRKNHDYRQGRLVVEKRALLYIDDDWQDEAIDWRNALSLAYGNIVSLQDPKTTTAEAYAYNLERSHELVHVAVHSYPTEHWFKTPPDQWQNNFDYRDVILTDPQSLFYMLYACSNARYIHANYMAGWYIFSPTDGLLAIGSTKIGSMLDFESFYEPLGENKSFGQAFLDWFQAQGGWLFESWEKCWYYGLTMCGDPLLKLNAEHPPLDLTAAVPVSATYHYDQEIDLKLNAYGGQPPYSWQIVSGSLPEGMIFNAADALIYGISDKFGCYDITLAVTDSDPTPRADTAQIQFGIMCGSGDANNDGAVNIGDLVYLNQYIFHNGPPPSKIVDADANCDNAVNFADLIIIVNHIFRSHPLNPCVNR